MVHGEDAYRNYKSAPLGPHKSFSPNPQECHKSEVAIEIVLGLSQLAKLLPRPAKPSLRPPGERAS